ncbi:Rrf2 family transcriptional regulator [Savagea sp. SN6]|uniref:Rrf2 family transcriptional regulator n=1 Tax=Savagea serpentis TaxID=2785297 RepID=A0A8J7KEW2_9BACL|nr:Rrf2 family transcriptional regulator [Savagea serpentis]MBF4501551.1 Rrf2 family transcriptional regulator [Savagea serpentis]
MINTRFSVAIHIISLIASNPNEQMSSEWIAGSVNTNPVVIRRIIGLLKKANIVRTSQGVAGVELVKCPSETTLLEIYNAVIHQDELFSVHEKPNVACPVGRNIQKALDVTFGEAQEAMEKVLAGKTVSDIIDDMR